MHKEENTYELNSSSWLSTWFTKCLLVLMHVYTYMGNSVFVSSGDEYLGKLLEFHKECQVPFRVSRGNVGFLLKRCSIKGPHLTWRGEFCGFCQVVYTYVYTHIYIHICVCTYMYVHTCMYTHIHICVYTYMCVESAHGLKKSWTWLREAAGSVVLLLLLLHVMIQYSLCSVLC